MLSLLHIENIALIEEADISFDRGFNVLTGETGAGKSIVIDAISAVIGERTSRDLIRTGAKSALVSGVFTDLPSLSWFEENGISPDENGELLISREILPDGKNQCRIGGKLCTVAQLKALGTQMVNIHGQHDGQQLLDEACHLSYLDRFGNHEAVLEDYRKAYVSTISIRREMERLQMDEAERQRKIDTLKFQIGELERAELKAGEDDFLKQRRDLLRNAEKLMGAVEQAYYALSGDENSDGAVSLLCSAEGSLRNGGRYSDEMSDLAEKAAEVRYAADDLAELVRDLREQFDFSPGELDEIESRLDVIYRLQKKYGNTVAEMLEYLEQCRTELDGIEYSADTIMKLESQYASALELARKKGGTLTEARKKSSRLLQTRIQEELRQLDMPKVCFEVEFSSKNTDIGMDASGMDEVRFLMSANVGENLKPIAKVASGGELARIMLALKNVLAENDDVTTLIFDEVDTGVSGRAAQKVAEKMASIAGYAQVLCVTHLPQIAAMADTHFSVEKGEKSGRTYTKVATLSEEGRRTELARLTSGEHIGSAALDSAGELLRAAAEYKKAVDKA